MSARKKAMSLITLALDSGASQEESRTAAVIAVRFIRDHNLLSTSFEDLFTAPVPEPTPPPPPPPRPRPAPPHRKPAPTKARKIIKSSFRGACKNCGVIYLKGQMISWAPGNAWCLDCFKLTASSN